MKQEQSVTGAIVGTIITLSVWALIIYVVISVISLAICGVVYVLWTFIIKPVFEALDNRIRNHSLAEPVIFTDREKELIALILITIILVPVAIWFFILCPPIGIAIFAVNFVAAIAILNPNNLLG